MIVDDSWFDDSPSLTPVWRPTIVRYHLHMFQFFSRWWFKLFDHRTIFRSAVFPTIKISRSIVRTILQQIKLLLSFDEENPYFGTPPHLLLTFSLGNVWHKKLTRCINAIINYHENFLVSDSLGSQTIIDDQAPFDQGFTLLSTQRITCRSHKTEFLFTLPKKLSTSVFDECDRRVSPWQNFVRPYQTSKKKRQKIGEALGLSRFYRTLFVWCHKMH